MNAKEQAMLDIQEDLQQNHKSFIAFHKELNPIMRKLVSKQIRRQQSLNPFVSPTHANSQLVARCFFAKGEAKLSNYSKYYEQ